SRDRVRAVQGWHVARVRVQLVRRSAAPRSRISWPREFNCDSMAATRPSTKYRHRVSGLLVLLFAITYIDRVCISVAGPRIQADLGIGPVGWGWVTAMFSLSYCFFEIPTGALGDRIGPRRVLTRVVLWWSAFTSLTGMVSNYYLLLLTR